MRALASKVCKKVGDKQLRKSQDELTDGDVYAYIDLGAQVQLGTNITNCMASAFNESARTICTTTLARSVLVRDLARNILVSVM